MKRLYSHFLFIIVLFFILHSNVNSQDLTPEQIYEKVNNCVVVILSYDFDGKLSKQGSGVVISDKGWVVTNYHVFAECEKIEIRHNDKIISYTDIIGVDIEKDILILKIDENVFPSLPIANSENLKVGQRVYAVGSPLGMENSLSEGLISGLRNVAKKNKDYIQITAGISPGSSGGAVVNSKGELIGISTSSLEGGQNLNFAIPSGEILKISTGTYNSKKYIEANNYFYKGYNADENGNYLDAIDYYTKFINLFPDKTVGYYNRGIAYGNLKEYYKAISDFNRAIEINPEDADAYFQRGNVYKNLLDYSKAISDYNKAIEINPKDDNAYSQRGNIYNNLLDYNKAISDYSKAIEINPEDASACYNMRGFAYRNLQEYSKAILDFNRVIEINPEDVFAYYMRGNAYYNLDMMSKACEDMKKAYSLGFVDALKFLQDFCR